MRWTEQARCVHRIGHRHPVIGVAGEDLRLELRLPVAAHGPQFQAQIFTRYADYGMSVADAVDAPRLLYGRTWGAESLSEAPPRRHRSADRASLRSARL
jgi:gamma-glutamyltranspeptidase